MVCLEFRESKSIRITNLTSAEMAFINGRWSCERCSCKSYKRRAHLMQHLRYECGVERQFECPICWRKFKRRGDLNTHKANVHQLCRDGRLKLHWVLDLYWKSKIKSRLYEFWSILLLSVSRFKQYRASFTNSHSAEIISLNGRWWCGRCTQRNYKRKAHLLRHLKLECGVEPQFPCFECGKRFKRASDLKYHETRVHNKQLPFRS